MSLKGPIDRLNSLNESIFFLNIPLSLPPSLCLGRSVNLLVQLCSQGEKHG